MKIFTVAFSSSFGCSMAFTRSMRPLDTAPGYWLLQRGQLGNTFFLSYRPYFDLTTYTWLINCCDFCNNHFNLLLYNVTSFLIRHFFNVRFNLKEYIYHILCISCGSVTVRVCPESNWNYQSSNPHRQRS